jgi:uncharacterized protein YbbC (DUF1343 family)
MKKVFCLFVFFNSSLQTIQAQEKPIALKYGNVTVYQNSRGDIIEFEPSILPAAYLMQNYLPLLKGKRVGIFANQTSTVGNSHLVDTLPKLGVKITVIFGPEHGFRGTADAGEKVSNYIDSKTGIPVVSLYGTKHKPTAEDLKNIDIILFDLQDVGCRFYTYINSMQDFMEAAIENNKPLVILDRPNPNGHYVDGPVLDLKFKSGVGKQPIPVVYGMTMGEYAYMIAGERWLSAVCNKKLDEMKEIAVANKDIPPYTSSKIVSINTWYNPKTIIANKFSLSVIQCGNYTHKSKYNLTVKPSPNLPNMPAIYLYPSTCFFEGTVLSEGRGTNKPFQVFGHPSLPKTLYSFTPNPNEGAKSSKLYGQVCYGWNVGGTPEQVLTNVNNRIQLKWLMEAYTLFPKKDSFFLKNNFFNKLAGNDKLMQQIKAGTSETDIRKSWEPALSSFKKVRKKYLLYEDFE